MAKQRVPAVARRAGHHDLHASLAKRRHAKRDEGPGLGPIGRRIHVVTIRRRVGRVGRVGRRASPTAVERRCAIPRIMPGVDAGRATPRRSDVPATYRARRSSGRRRPNRTKPEKSNSTSARPGMNSDSGPWRERRLAIKSVIAARAVYDPRDANEAPTIPRRGIRMRLSTTLMTNAITFATDTRPARHRPAM